jgi:hypothetical protein
MSRKSGYFEFGKVNLSLSFRIPFIDQDFDWSWEFALCKLTVHDYKKNPSQGNANTSHEEAQQT